MRGATALAAWFSKNFVNRRDTYGRYLPPEKRTADREIYTAKGEPTLAVLKRHFEGKSTGDLIGLHSTARDEAAGEGEVPSCWCRWLAVDIDRHDDATDPESTLKAALALYRTAVDLGFRPLLLDSNGKGGYHLLLILAGPVPSHRVYALGKWLTRDWRSLGLDQDPEIFPKQPTIPAGGFGNWIRLPGRHHTRDHFTRVWDGTKWLAGSAAIKAIVGTHGSPADLIPAEALATPRPVARPKGMPKPEDFQKDATLAATALEYLDPSMPYPEWLSVGMALTQLGRDGLNLWDSWSSASDKYREGICDRKWRSFRRDGVKLGTLFHMAKARGFEFPKSPKPEVDKPLLRVVGEQSPDQAPAPDEARPEDRGLPIILLGSDATDDGLKKWTTQTLDAVAIYNDPPQLFQRGKLLVRVREDDQVGGKVIEPHSLDSLRGLLDRAACWGTPYQTKKGETRTKYGPPRIDVVKDVMALPRWDHDVIPPLDAIIDSPRFLPDGRLVTDPGYHRDGRLLYSPPAGLLDIAIPKRPSAWDVESAKAIIFDELLVDFPFANQASRANALACMLLPFVRMMIDGQTPFHMFESSTEGTGKGLCAYACSCPALGRGLPSTPQKEDEAEWRKAITSALKSGRSHFFVDNMYNPRGWDGTPLPVDSGTLASALTQSVWTDRLLGGNDEPGFRITTIWMGSGNNVEWSRELGRRVVPITLVPATQNPFDRTGFKHDPLEEWADENRAALVKACLVLCRRWIVEGSPNGPQKYGSYQGYANVMGGILGVAGVDGFLGNRRQMSGKDRETQRWPDLVLAWHNARGSSPTSSGDVFDLIFGRIEQGARHGGDPDLQVAFADVVGDGKELSQKQKLGHAIGKQDGRVWGSYRIVRSRAKAHNGSPLYRLLDPAEPFDSGDDDDA